MFYLIVLLTIFSFFILFLMEVNRRKLSSEELERLENATFQNHWWFPGFFIILMIAVVFLSIGLPDNYTYIILFFLSLIVWGMFIQGRISKVSLPRNVVLRDLVLKVLLLTSSGLLITICFFYLNYK